MRLGALKYTRTSEGLTEFPSNISSEVTWINLMANKIIDVPLDLNQTSLRYLYLDVNWIADFPDLSSVSATLNVLGLSYNKITKIPADLLNALTRLSYFRIASNPIIEVIPDVSGPGTTLTNMDVSHVHVDIFPMLENLGKSLRYLYISTSLKGNPDAIGQIENRIPTTLHTFDTSSNDLSRFPNLNRTADTLKNLYLSNNLINHIEADLLDQLVVLSQLYLDGNQLANIPDVPGPGDSLTILDLSDTLIEDVPDIPLMGGVLQTLKLNDCPMTLDGISFPGKLSIFPDLVDLMIKGMAANVLAKMCQLNHTQELHVWVDFPLVCDENITWIYLAQLSGVLMLKRDDYLCEEPNQMKGVSWETVTLSQLLQSGEYYNVVSVLQYPYRILGI